MEPCCPCICSPDPCCDSVHITLKQSIGSLALNRVKKTHFNHTTTALSTAQLQQCHPDRGAVPNSPSFLIPHTAPDYLLQRTPQRPPHHVDIGQWAHEQFVPLGDRCSCGQGCHGSASTEASAGPGDRAGSALPWVGSGLLPAFAQPPHSAHAAAVSMASVHRGQQGQMTSVQLSGTSVTLHTGTARGDHSASSFQQCSGQGSFRMGSTPPSSSHFLMNASSPIIKKNPTPKYLKTNSLGYAQHGIP